MKLKKALNSTPTKDVELMDLPEEMLLRIMTFLPSTEVVQNVAYVCTLMLQLSLESVKIVGKSGPMH